MSATARTGLALAVFLLAAGAIPDGMVYPGLRSLTIDRFGVDRVEASYFTLAPALGAILGAFVLPRLGRGSSPVATLRNASLVEAGLVLLMTLPLPYGAVLGLRLLGGAADLAGIAASLRIVARVAGDGHRGRAMGIAGTAIMLGLVAGIALGALTGSLSPFATLPVAAATLVAVALATVPLARIAPAVHAADPPVPPAIAPEGRRERIIASLMLASDRGLAAALSVIVPLAFGGEAGLPKATVGALLALPMLGMALGSVPGGFLVDRFGALRVRVGGAILFGFGTLALVEAEAIGAGAMFAAAALAGLGAAPLFPSALALGTRDRGATGVYGAIQAAGQGGYALGNLALAIAAALAALAGVEGVPPSRTLAVAAIVYVLVNLVVAIAAPTRDWAGAEARAGDTTRR